MWKLKACVSELQKKKYELPLPLSLSLSGLDSAHITLPSTPVRISRPPTCTQTRSKWDQLRAHPYSWGRSDIITWVHSESPTPMHLRRYHKVKRGRVWRHMRIHAGVRTHLLSVRSRRPTSVSRKRKAITHRSGLKISLLLRECWQICVRAVISSYLSASNTQLVVKRLECLL